MGAVARILGLIMLVSSAVACAGSPAAAPPAAASPPATSPPATAPVDVSGRLGDWTPSPLTRGGLETLASVGNGEWTLHTGGGDRDFIAGVNLGPTVPGRQPGEQAIPREDFRRWFPEMHRLGLRAVRVYTIMPPAFYEELAAFNVAHPDTPLYLMHGVWIPEEEFYATSDLFAPGVRDEFHAEIERAVAVVHGTAELPDRPGHAGGRYTADVSPWLAAWVVGVEWDPFATAASDAANRGRSPFTGTYFRSAPGASPTEVWLAEALDRLAGLEAKRGVSMPIAFVNWPTTDPLPHPTEPLEEEDMVGVDANHVVATPAWPGGTFASYHAYPYYPDFQRREEGIAGFELGGRPDNYAGYLTALRDHHDDLPVMITEFGVPSGMAHAHFGPQGRDQGGHAEQTQMAIDAELLGVIHDVGMSGALVFEWLDEWFKFTWNTIDFELPPDRRQLWLNPWTNEAHFGLVAVEPGPGPVVVVDGDGGEWQANGSQVIHESRGAVREVRAVKDEAYLHLLVQTDRSEAWREAPLVVGLDVVAGGSPALPAGGASWPEADYAVVIDGSSGKPAATVMVRGGNDPLLWQYGVGLGMVPFAPEEVDDSSWGVQRLIVNRPLIDPSTGEELPAEIISPGELVRGTSDPDDPDFDSRSAWNAAGKVVELRLPYQAIGFSDPSSLTAYRMTEDGGITTEQVDRVGIAVVAHGELHVTGGYAWEPWQRPTWHERPKAGIAALADELLRVGGSRTQG